MCPVPGRAYGVGQVRCGIHPQFRLMMQPPPPAGCTGVSPPALPVAGDGGAGSSLVVTPGDGGSGATPDEALVVLVND